MKIHLIYNLKIYDKMYDKIQDKNNKINCMIKIIK